MISHLAKNFPNSNLTELHELVAQVIVVGGGLAGICAAIAAAREGATVILVHDRPVLGGNASSEVRMHISGANVAGRRTETDSRETGIIEEVKLDEAVVNPQRSASIFDLLLYEKVRGEPNIKLLLNTYFYSVKLRGDKIEQAFAYRPNTEDVFCLKGDIVVDCTGDGRLGAEAGAEFMVGREGKCEYGEDLAPKTRDQSTMGSTILFITKEYNRPIAFDPPDWARIYHKCDDLPFRDHKRYEYGFWWVEWGGTLDTIKDTEKIRDELLAIALGVWDHIKNQADHGAENWGLEWIGFLPGKRESRRFKGDYVLNQNDLEEGRICDDQVAYGGWPIDLHPPSGIEAEKPLEIQRYLKKCYSIPLRSLYSKNVPNLMMAGRNISVSHVALGSTRVMGTCSVIGQAVGTAAAQCVKEGVLPKEIVERGDQIKKLQQTLLKNDCYLLGIKNDDPEDLARSANIYASSETDKGPASHIIDGINRGVYGNSHRWISDPNKPLPQWIELIFKDPNVIDEIHLTWNTGLHRPLSLSHSDVFTEKMIRGPQPETAKDYKIILGPSAGEKNKVILSVKNNHQRKRIHTFQPTLVSKVRIIVQSTNGSPSAQLFEVRLYHQEKGNA